MVEQLKQINYHYQNNEWQEKKKELLDAGTDPAEIDALQ